MEALASFSPLPSAPTGGAWSTAESVGGERHLRVYSTLTGSAPRELESGFGGVGARFSPDGRQVISVDFHPGVDGFNKPKSVDLWNADTGKHLATLAGAAAIAPSVDYTPEGAPHHLGPFR